jgi:hypothetical protein
MTKLQETARRVEADNLNLASRLAALGGKSIDPDAYERGSEPRRICRQLASNLKWLREKAPQLAGQKAAEQRARANEKCLREFYATKGLAFGAKVTKVIN